MPPVPERFVFACVLVPALAGAALVPAHARAQDDGCGGASIHETLDIDVKPAHGASGVARDAPVVVRYLSEAALDALEASLADDETLVSLLREPDTEGDPREVVAGSVHAIDSRTIAFVPDRRLDAETRYYPVVAKPGFDAPAFAELRLETGSELDAEPPSLSVGPDGIALSSEPIGPGCEGPPGGLRIGVSFPPASDDGDEGSIEYFLYLTRGFGVHGPELRARARDHDGTVRMSLFLTQQQSRERACVAVRAVDGVGKPAANEPELCFDPIEGSHFEDCTAEAAIGATHAGPRARTSLAFGAGWLALVAVRRRRH